METNIRVRGSRREWKRRAFQERTSHALEMIRKNDPVNWRRVNRHLESISQFDHTMGVDLENRVFTVGTKIWAYTDTEWYASCIVHEAIHVMLQDRFGIDWYKNWKNKDAHESIGMRVQARFLRRVNQDHPRIRLLERRSLNPYHHYKTQYTRYYD